jgi:alginate O-acetyltransferase complex protein AlgI
VRRPWLARLGVPVLVMLVTYLFVDVTWVFFRAKSFAEASRLLGAMAGLHPTAKPLLPMAWIVETLVAIGGILLAHAYMRARTLEDVVSRVHPALLATAWAAMAFLVIITQGSGDAFIYFQF